MNWSKAKTILIVTFLVLNLYLVSQLIMQRNSSITITEYNAVNESTLTLLREKYNIDVSLEKLDKGVSPNVNPEVGYKLVDKDALIKNLWPTKTVFPNAEGRYVLENEYLIIGRNDYYYNNLNRQDRLMSKSYLNIIKDNHKISFMSGILKKDLENALGIEFNNWILSGMQEIEENDEVFYSFTFTQLIDLEVYDISSYTRVKISSNGSIVEVKRSELEKKANNKNFIDKINEKISLSEKTKKISAAEALLFLAGQKPYEGNISIDNIKLIYFGLKQSDLDQSENIPFMWPLKPVWKIDTISEDGTKEVYFLDAYTGKLE
ncbi:hypothetical protein IMX26_11775 [Clostridium sp. 'deep sea']|uniref:hypothetical protein n=1 Tax=Clostridium sp. 'deep sea' TaxID=2779445 RepID=UPI0018966B8E|nr:hypothetical protein [Clostridium sp. 'deep sea']QOR34166.1 hypothetical protein IMX26_11775 [Clostridium sp. 'deep sea']